MELAYQVTTSQQSEKIATLGFKRDSLYGWYCSHESGWMIDYTDEYSQFPAYTASELMDILPSTIVLEDGARFLQVIKSGGIYHVKYFNEENYNLASIVDRNITLALGYTLIYLLENKLMPVE